MGYTTNFQGALKFTGETTPAVLAELNKYIGKDRREIGYSDDSIYEGGKYGNYWYHFDYELTSEFDGIMWNGSEKSYCMEDIANWLIDKMKQKFPDFGLSGEMQASGEDYDDRWLLKIVDGRAVHEQQILTGEFITCPHCEERFLASEGNN